ncbi:MAG: hypothetical protein WC512_00615 [Candidatus Omnitrophota bacterium]
MEDKRDMMPEDEYLKRMSSLPKVKAPDDFLQKVRARIEERPFREKLMHALFVPVRIKIPLEVAAATATLLLVISTLEVTKPAKQLAYAPKSDMAEEAVVGNVSNARLADEFCLKCEKAAPSLEERILAAGGRIIRENAVKDKSGEPYIDVEVPADRYQDFMSKLNDLKVSGKIRIMPVLKEAPHDRNIIQLRIFVI